MEPSEEPTSSEEPSESPTGSQEPTEDDLETIAEIICDPLNADIFGNFCTLIRVTGIDFFLNDFEILDIDFDDFFTFVNNGPFRRYFNRVFNRRNLQGYNSWLNNVPQNAQQFIPQNVQNGDIRDYIPNFALAGEFNTFFRRTYGGYLIRNPYNFDNFVVVEFDRFLNDFRRAFPERIWTVFVPTNAALQDLGVDVNDLVDGILAAENQNDFGTVLYTFVENHIIARRELLYSDLRCGRQYQMTSGEFTRTECSRTEKFQLGQGNTVENRGMILREFRNILASNGVIQVLDRAILQQELVETTDEPTVSPMPTVSSAPSAVPTLSAAPSLVPSVVPSLEPTPRPTPA